MPDRTLVVVPAKKTNHHSCQEDGNYVYVIDPVASSIMRMPQRIYNEIFRPPIASLPSQQRPVVTLTHESNRPLNLTSNGIRIWHHTHYKDALNIIDYELTKFAGEEASLTFKSTLSSCTYAAHGRRAMGGPASGAMTPSSRPNLPPRTRSTSRPAPEREPPGDAARRWMRSPIITPQASPMTPSSREELLNLSGLSLLSTQGNSTSATQPQTARATTITLMERLDNLLISIRTCCGRIDLPRSPRSAHQRRRNDD